MREIVIDEVKSLHYLDKVDYRIKYSFKGSRMVGEYRINSEKELTQEEMIKAIQQEIYGFNYGVDYSSAKDFTVVVKLDTEQIKKIEDLAKLFDDFNKTKRVGVIE